MADDRAGLLCTHCGSVSRPGALCEYCGARLAAGGAPNGWALLGGALLGLLALPLALGSVVCAGFALVNDGGPRAETGLASMFCLVCAFVWLVLAVLAVGGARRAVSTGLRTEERRRWQSAPRQKRF